MKWRIVLLHTHPFDGRLREKPCHDYIAHSNIKVNTCTIRKVNTVYYKVMKLIFAQGNPDPEYASTRHNVGWIVLDAIVSEYGGVFQQKTKFRAYIAETTIHGQKVILAKPTTYYNETGTSAQAIANFYKIPPTDILVLHDELALPFGTLRTREQGSDAGNKGIRSLNAHLGPHYMRLRVGIGNDLASKIPAPDFVLSRFSLVEHKQLQEHVLPKAVELIEDFARGRLASTSIALELTQN